MIFGKTVWSIIETMAIRSTFWLMLLGMLGVRCKDEIHISTDRKNTTSGSNDPDRLLHFYLVYRGDTDFVSPRSSRTLSVDKSAIICSERNIDNFFLL